jgi:predicted phosphodiesterase
MIMMRFVVMSDTHFYVSDKVKHSIFWNRSLEGKGEEIAQCIVHTIKRIDPDFIIHCGDFIDRGYKKCFEFAKQKMDELLVPWYLVPGNHDVLGTIIRNEISLLYDLPYGQNYYSKNIGPIHFIFLDTCYWLTTDKSILLHRDEQLYKAGMLKGYVMPPEELSWLKEELEANRHKNVILISHLPLKYKSTYPIATLPDGTEIEYGAGCSPKLFLDSFKMNLLNEDEVSSLIKGYDNIKAVFSGHWHINDVYNHEGIIFCQTCSLREYPFELRVVDIKEKSLEVTTQPLISSEFAEKSFVKERKNYWVKGRPSDRNFTIKL